MEELNRQRRIEAETARLNGFFQVSPDSYRAKELSMLESMIQNAAFMRITMEDLQEIINRDGPVESYQNGENQKGMKQSAALQSYNVVLKNYTAVMKKLQDLMPTPRELSYHDSYVARMKELDILNGQDEEESEEEEEEEEEKLPPRFNSIDEASAEYDRQREIDPEIKPFLEWCSDYNYDPYA